MQIHAQRARIAAAVLAASSFLLLFQEAAFAQGYSLLGGVVVDQYTREPVPGATISVESAGIEVDAREDGSFGFYQLPVGFVTIRVTAPERPALVDRVEVAADEVTFVRFLLPAIDAVLSELLVEGSPREDYPADLTAAELIAREVPGLSSVRPGVGDQAYYGRVKLRGSSSLAMSGEPLIFLNGIQIGGLSRALNDLAQIPANDIANISVLMGPAAAFLQAFGSNGAILVETKSGPTTNGR